jgi:hypothetical protein
MAATRSVWLEEQQAAGAVLRSRGLWLLQITGNLVVASAAVAWLWIPEARLWQVGLTAAVPVLGAALWLWLHGSTLVFLERQAAWPVAWKESARQGLRRIPPLAVWLTAGLLVAWGLTYVAGLTTGVPVRSASKLTMWLSRPVSPETTGNLWTILWTLTYTLLLPALLIPVAARVALQGIRGFLPSELATSWISTLGQGSYWRVVVAAWVIGAWVPYHLTQWAPGGGNISLESLSWLLRFGVAYLLALFAWLWVLALTVRLQQRRETA